MIEFLQQKKYTLDSAGELPVGYHTRNYDYIASIDGKEVETFDGDFNVLLPRKLGGVKIDTDCTWWSGSKANVALIFAGGSLKAGDKCDIGEVDITCVPRQDMASLTTGTKFSCNTMRLHMGRVKIGNNSTIQNLSVRSIPGPGRQMCELTISSFCHIRNLTISGGKVAICSKTVVERLRADHKDNGHDFLLISDGVCIVDAVINCAHKIKLFNLTCMKYLTNVDPLYISVRNKSGFEIEIDKSEFIQQVKHENLQMHEVDLTALVKVMLESGYHLNDDDYSLLVTL